MEHSPHGLVERRIGEALDRGDFDRIDGSGEPIPGLARALPADWWARRWVEHDRRRAESDALAARIAAVAERIWLLEDRSDVERAIAVLDRRLAAAGRAPLDAGAVVRRWEEMAPVRRRLAG